MYQQSDSMLAHYAIAIAISNYCTIAWVDWPERAKDKAKQAGRAQSRPEEPQDFYFQIFSNKCNFPHITSEYFRIFFSYYLWIFSKSRFEALLSCQLKAFDPSRLLQCSGFVLNLISQKDSWQQTLEQDCGSRTMIFFIQMSTIPPDSKKWYILYKSL